MSDLIIPVLVGYLIIRELFFMYTTKQLVDRIMAGSYHGYEAAKTISKQSKPENTFIAPEDPDDLGALSEFTQ